MGNKRGAGNPVAAKILTDWVLKNKTFSNEMVFIENATIARHHVKKRIITQNLIEYKCELCENNGEWLGKPLVLILDHKNGVNNDNRLENLRFLCSNCDSQLPTYKNRRGNKKENN